MKQSGTQTFFPDYSGYSAGSIAYYWASTDSVKGQSSYISFYSDIPYIYNYQDKTKTFTMEREHIWPQSRASYYQTGGGADLHHLRPSVSEINRAKSDHYFANVQYIDLPHERLPAYNGYYSRWGK